MGAQSGAWHCTDRRKETANAPRRGGGAIAILLITDVAAPVVSSTKEI